MEVRILGAHSIEVKDMRMTSLLIDGVLAIDAGSLTSSLSLTEQQRIKAILLTHQHFDHTRDLVTFGANGAMFSSPVRVHALGQALDVITSCLLDGRMYVDFSKWPSEEAPFLQTEIITPYEKKMVEDYEILAIPVKHAAPAVGYQVVSQEGKSMFYTGDTGPGFSASWEHISPQLLITEVSGLNKHEDLLRRVGHLSAKLLKEELVRIRQVKEYLPRVIAVHISPHYEGDIRREIDEIAEEMGITIEVGYEGMMISL